MEFDWTTYIENHQDNMGKFKIGSVVRYIGQFSEYYGQEFKVLASNVQDSESTEYCLEGFPYLVWEEELICL